MAATQTSQVALDAASAFSALVDPGRFGEWCTFHGGWTGAAPERLDGVAFGSIIALLGRPAPVTWQPERTGDTTVVLHGTGPRGMTLGLGLGTEPAGASASRVVLTLAVDSPAFDDRLRARIGEWSDEALGLCAARFGDVVAGRPPRERLEPAADTTVAFAGLGFTECPRWHDGRLYFVDMITKEIRVSDDLESSRVVATLDDTPGGLGWLPDGSLLVVAQNARRILRQAGDRFVTHADLAAATTSPLNDLYVDPTGRAYVGEMGFDVHAFIQSAPGEEVAMAPGSVHALAPDGTLIASAGGLSFPNGIVAIDGGSSLVVGESFGSTLAILDVSPAGRLAERRTYAGLEYFPDGLAVDRDDHVWVAATSARCAVRVSPRGEVVATVRTAQNCFAVELGGPDGTTLICCTSPESDHDLAGQLMQSQIECAAVEVGRAG